MNRWLHKAGKTADKIITLGDEYDTLDDTEVKALADELRETIASSENESKALDKSLIPAYALAYQASKRALGLTPYRVQIIGAIALHEGKIAQQSTGEGKTLTALMPSFLHSLTGRGVHVVTVNDYLAKRDADNIGRALTFLGASVGCITSESSRNQRREAYAQDVTYIPNSELGFDYLRDNMVVRDTDTVQRDLVYAIIDEADSILIDEARTPLIISGAGKDVSHIYTRANHAVKQLTAGDETRKFNKADAYLGIEREESGDYIVHEREQNVVLTADGVAKIEQLLGIDSLADKNNRQLRHAIERSLRAHALMKKGREYVVKNGEILIVDPHTGRAMEGRQYSDGLHQAIEAKEGVDVSPVNVTVATTTYQNFFRKYERISGMTGTAYSERKELKQTYGLNVVVIPNNRPMIREDEADRLYKYGEDKHEAIVSRATIEHEAGRPILIGTASVTESELVSKRLTKAGIAHNVLSATQDEHEAEIIANAGKIGSVTVATDMAGRGTDIILDDEAKEKGGLLVIGCERHDSRRIDDQLRGRAGRQGDPGSSAFYLSLEDKVMRLYGSERFKKRIADNILTEDGEITVRGVLSAINRAQKIVNSDNLAARRDVLEYDDVNDAQRERIYRERKKLLSADAHPTDELYSAIMAVLDDMLAHTSPETWSDTMSSTFGIDIDSSDMDGKLKKVKSRMKRLVTERYVQMLTERGSDIARQCLLMAIDEAWADHLIALDFARDSVAYVGYGQSDPKSIYAKEAWGLYEKMRNEMHKKATKMWMNTTASSTDNEK